jgi:DNA polymerase-3 subunit gamma/tau
VFENVLGQSAADQLILDINANTLAPAMLFSGPAASGKGTAALELARITSCEAGPASWGCRCPACSRHRLLIHPDLLCLGWRPFSAEIAASAASLLRETSPATRMLFIRAVRKLLARFNPVLWEDEPKGAKFFPLVSSLEEDLEELDLLAEDPESSDSRDNIAKLLDGMIKTAFKLESDGVSETIPIGQIRRAAWWSRLAPLGREKLIVIENAGRMQEEARNSLLKLLEEPPGRSRYVLCATRPGALPATVLSRLRVYRFSARDAAVENEVIRRVFRDEIGEDVSGACGIVSTYIDSFLPVSAKNLEGLAAFFSASAAYKAAVLAKKQGRPIPEEVVLLGKSSAPKAEEAGFGRPKDDSAAVIAIILEKAGKFEARSIFTRFLYFLLEQASGSRQSSPAFHEIWKQCSAWADSAAGIYNLRPALVLEKLFTDLSQRMAKL